MRIKEKLFSIELFEEWILLIEEIVKIDGSHFNFFTELPELLIKLGDIKKAQKIFEISSNYFYEKKRFQSFINYIEKLKINLELDDKFYSKYILVEIISLEPDLLEKKIIDYIKDDQIIGHELCRCLDNLLTQIEISRQRQLVVQSIISISEIKNKQLTLKGLKKILNNLFESVIVLGPNSSIVIFFKVFLDNANIVVKNTIKMPEEIQLLFRKDFFQLSEFYKSLVIKKIPLESNFDLGADLFKKEEVLVVNQDVIAQDDEIKFKEFIPVFTGADQIVQMDKSFSAQLDKTDINFEEMKELAVFCITSEMPVSCGKIISKMRGLANTKQQKMYVDYLNAHCLFVFEKYDELEIFINYAISVIPMTNVEKVGYLKLMSLSKRRQGNLEQHKSIERLISKFEFTDVEE